MSKWSSQPAIVQKKTYFVQLVSLTKYSWRTSHIHKSIKYADPLNVVYVVPNVCHTLSNMLPLITELQSITFSTLNFITFSVFCSKFLTFSETRVKIKCEKVENLDVMGIVIILRISICQ